VNTDIPIVCFRGPTGSKSDMFKVPTLMQIVFLCTWALRLIQQDLDTHDLLSFINCSFDDTGSFCPSSGSLIMDTQTKSQIRRILTRTSSTRLQWLHLRWILICKPRWQYALLEVTSRVCGESLIARSIIRRRAAAFEGHYCIHKSTDLLCELIAAHTRVFLCRYFLFDKRMWTELRDE
jgi:hypothetical protein